MKIAEAKVGRPPRVTPKQIAEAALEVGLDRATIRNVAEKLQMSVPGLYHHVRTRDELLAVAAAHALGSLRLSEDPNQHWTEWLIEYARLIYDGLVAQPEVVEQIRTGAVNTLHQTQHIEKVLEQLAHHGFSVTEAFEAYLQVMTAATGAATARIARRTASEAGHPPLEDFSQAVELIGRDSAPFVHRLVGALRRSRRARDIDPFDTVRLVVEGIATRRGSR